MFTKRNRTDYIVVHCAATPPKMDVGAKEIDRWHRDKGWLAIGYHYVIRRNGVLEPGRPQDVQGSHVKGYNSISVGVCMVGGVNDKNQPENNFTDAQWQTLLRTVTNLRVDYPNAKVIGHHNLDKYKACPSFNAVEWWKSQQK